MGHSGMFAYMRGASSESAKPKVTRRLLMRVLAYARPYLYQIIALLATILITTVLGLLTPLIFRDLIDNTLPNNDTDRLNMLAIALVMIPAATGIIRVVQRWLNAAVGEGVIFDLRVALFDHLQKMSLNFFTNTKTGELMSRLNNDVVDAQRAISNTLVEIITNGITVTLTLGVMITLEWRLTILGVMVLPAFIVLMRRVGMILREIARETMQYNAQMNAMMNETLNISGALLVKLFGRRVIEVDRFEDRATKVRDMGIRRAVIGTQFFVLMGLVSAIGTALVYWVGGHMHLNNPDDFSIGTIVAFSAFLAQLYGPMQALTNAPVEFATSLVSFERVFEVIDLPLEIDDKPDAIELQEIEGQLTFDNISFRYELNEEHLLTDVKRYNREDSVMATISGDNKSESTGNGETQAREDALENINFTIEPGQLAALVGPSGAGKTTLTYLIPRLYDPTEGHVLIDGHDLRDVTLESLAQQIGMVTQETYLFHDTVRTNLLYAKLDATQQEIESACKAANIHDFIMDLSDGYNTIVGERGYRLSGGEKQRMALARVILKDPRILVLDEATSSLDSQSEALIQDALKKVQKGRTSIVIAHRLSTILAADMILVMNRGRIVEHGTHDELLAEGGLYAGLYETQFSEQHEMA
jgi:ATP-binding cassette, subfamily B, bacterial